MLGLGLALELGLMLGLGLASVRARANVRAGASVRARANVRAGASVRARSQLGPKFRSAARNRPRVGIKIVVGAKPLGLGLGLNGSEVCLLGYPSSSSIVRFPINLK